MERQQLAVLSTAHLTKQDVDLLEKECDNLDLTLYPGTVVSYKEYGWFLSLPPDIDSYESFQQLTEASFSGAFIYLVNVLKSEGIDYILFNRDAPESTLFATFDW